VLKVDNITQIDYVYSLQTSVSDIDSNIVENNIIEMLANVYSSTV